MASNVHAVSGLVLIVVGGGAILGCGLLHLLSRTGFRVSPAFKVVTRQERAAAEDRGAVAQRRFVWVGSMFGLLLVVVGAVLVAV